MCSLLRGSVLPLSGLRGSYQSGTLFKPFLGLLLSGSSTLWICAWDVCLGWPQLLKCLIFPSFFPHALSSARKKLLFIIMWLGERWWVNSSSFFSCGNHPLESQFNIGWISLRISCLAGVNSCLFLPYPLVLRIWSISRWHWLLPSGQKWLWFSWV